MKPKQALIDCRSHADFCQGHLPQACNLPAQTLSERMHELPDASMPIVLCGALTDMHQASQFLQEKGYQVVEQRLWQSEFAQVMGATSQRLWQPSPLVLQFVSQTMSQQAVLGGKGLDIACGAGRDAVFLAMHGWQMTGVDVKQPTLARVRQLADSQSVHVDTLCVDIETGQDPFAMFADASFDLINVARYLHRPLFPFIKRLIKPNGFLLYHTFMVGSEVFGSPKNPNYLLAEKELSLIFADDDVVMDDILRLPDGRPMSMFMVRCH